jgi:hypothetical protein
MWVKGTLWRAFNPSLRPSFHPCSAGAQSHVSLVRLPPAVELNPTIGIFYMLHGCHLFLPTCAPNKHERPDPLVSLIWYPRRLLPSMFILRVLASPRRSADLASRSAFFFVAHKTVNASALHSPAHTASTGTHVPARGGAGGGGPKRPGELFVWEGVRSGDIAAVHSRTWAMYMWGECRSGVWDY